MPATLDPPCNAAPDAPRAGHAPRVTDWRMLEECIGPFDDGGVPHAADDPARRPKLIEEVIRDYFTLSVALPGIARRHHLSLEGLADLMEAPDFCHLMDRMMRLAEKRSRDLAVHMRPTAICALETMIATADDPERSRKACDSLLRASELELYPDQFRRARRTPRRNPLDAVATSAPADAEPDPESPIDPNASPEVDAPPDQGDPGVHHRTQIPERAPRSMAAMLRAAAGSDRPLSPAKSDAATREAQPHRNGRPQAAPGPDRAPRRTLTPWINPLSNSAPAPSTPINCSSS